MGTDTPFSFFASDVATWLRLRGYDIGSAGCGLGEGGLGSVRIGRLRWGRQGPAARHLVQDGSLEVRVDRHGSHVGNPFAGASVHQLCKAYDELLRAVLVAPLLVDDGLREFEALRHDTTFGLSLLSSFEKTLLQQIAEKHGVKIHRQRVRPLAVRDWLVYYALLVSQGVSLTLHCWCTHGDSSLPPWACHSQSLMGALLWVAVTMHDELALARQRLFSGHAFLRDRLAPGVLAEVCLLLTYA